MLMIENVHDDALVSIFVTVTPLCSFPVIIAISLKISYASNTRWSYIHRKPLDYL